MNWNNEYLEHFLAKIGFVSTLLQAKYMQLLEKKWIVCKLCLCQLLKVGLYLGSYIHILKKCINSQDRLNRDDLRISKDGLKLIKNIYLVKLRCIFFVWKIHIIAGIRLKQKWTCNKTGNSDKIFQNLFSLKHVWLYYNKKS